MAGTLIWAKGEAQMTKRRTNNKKGFDHKSTHTRLCLCFSSSPRDFAVVVAIEMINKVFVKKKRKKEERRERSDRMEAMKEHLVAIDIHVFLPIIFSLFCFQPLTRGIQTMSCLISFSDIFILTALSHALTGTSVFFFPKIYWCKLLSSCPVHRRYFGINGLIEYLSYSEPKHVNK